MHRRLLIGVAALAIMSGSAWGQAAVVEITPEQRTVIREYVVEKKVKTAKVKGEIRVGVAVPAGVELVAVPQTWGPELQRYRYVYWDDRVALVDPDSRTVVEIVE